MVTGDIGHKAPSSEPANTLYSIFTLKVRVLQVCNAGNSHNHIPHMFHPPPNPGSRIFRLALSGHKIHIHHSIETRPYSCMVYLNKSRGLRWHQLMVLHVLSGPLGSHAGNPLPHLPSYSLNFCCLNS